MNKLAITLLALYSLSGVGLQYFASLGDLKIYVVAAALSLLSMSWIASQLDG